MDLGAIQVNKYVTGAYNLIVSITDTISKVKISSIKNVFVYNPSNLDTSYAGSGNTNILLSEFGQMTMGELNEVFAQSKYVATQEEINRWKHISVVNAKREFLSKFWQSRDEDAFTPQNETMEKYFERVRFADTHYNNISQKYGWKTDMGRVYILYGEPYEIERHPNDSNIKPYEIWTYDDIEGGVIFVFGDKFDTGNFRLLNSTKRGELEDPDWKKWLYAR